MTEPLFTMTVAVFLSGFEIKKLEWHHPVMRTTLTLDDDVLAEANNRAAALRISLGKAVSDLARRGIQAAPPAS